LVQYSSLIDPGCHYLHLQIGGAEGLGTAASVFWKLREGILSGYSSYSCAQQALEILWLSTDNADNVAVAVSVARTGQLGWRRMWVEVYHLDVQSADNLLGRQKERLREKQDGRDQDKTARTAFPGTPNRSWRNYSCWL
jgi:hypothetical protein